MKNILTWLDHNIITLLTGFLIVMIPLYPKIPLAELIQGYGVRLRLEDLLVLFTLIVWFVQLLRKKILFPKNKISTMMLIYLVIGFLSCLSAIYITHTISSTRDQIFKLWLHFFRRIEYFSLFFITYSAIRTKKDLILLAKVSFATLVGVILYGIGQKYFYFPAFSTMNREFSKGVRLYLQPNSRLLSTFGGHYDLAGYLMMLISFTLPSAWLTAKQWLKTLLYITSLIAYWCLVLTTSRTSFIGFIVGITVVSALLIKSKGWSWSLKKWFITMAVSFVIMFTFSNLLERFLQVLPNKETRDYILDLQKIVNQPFVTEPQNSQSVAELPSLFSFLFQNQKPKPLELTEAEKTQLESVASTSDVPPSVTKPTPPPLPSDVSQESEDIRKETLEDRGLVYTGTQYSPNALKYGLSMAIRLDALWPMAIKGWQINPLLGSGYSTLTKSNVNEFTFAESTDNDYLRMLGETGLLGTISFLSIIYFVIKYASANLGRTEGILFIISLGAIGATVAMLITATYIDIFESSKVAYVFWIIVAGVAYIYDNQSKKA